MAGRFSVEAVFKAVDRVTAPVSRMQQRVSKFTRSMVRGLRAVNRGWDKLHSSIKRVARGFTVGAALVAVSTAAMAQSGLDFEQAITNVGAVALKTRDEIAPLEALAKHLGATTKFTATEAANAMEILARAGFNTQQILQATPAVLSAAAASGLEIAEVADHVSNVLKGMGLEMDQAGRVSDVLALASSRTNSSIGSLGESMRNVASTARQLGIPLESVVASVALLQDVGLDASVAGSAFNVMLTKMAAPSAGMQKKMRRLGITFKDAKGNMLPLQKVLQQLSVASEKAGGNFDKVAFLAELVGLRGQKAAANLAELFETGKITDLTEELNKAAGSAERMASIRMDTTRGSLTLLASAVDAVKVQIFDMNSGPLKKTIDLMTKWVGENQDLIATRVTEFINEIVTNLPEIWTWIKRIGGALVVFYTFGAVLKTIAAVMMLVNLAMAMNPLGLLVIGVALLIAGFAALIIWIDDFVERFEKMPGLIKLVLAPLRLLLHGIKFIKNAFKGGIGFAWDESKKAFGIGEGEPAAVQGAAQVVSPQDRTAKMIEERRSTSSAEVTIKDETGRAQVSRGKLGSGVELVPTGSM